MNILLIISIDCVSSSSKINNRNSHTEVLFERAVEKDFGKFTVKKLGLQTTELADIRSRARMYNTWLISQRHIKNPVQHLKMKRFAKIVNSFKLLTIFATVFI